jgi:hypothetical protein
MLDVAKFVYKSYETLHGSITYSQVLSLLDKFEDNVIVVRENDEIVGVAIYLMTDDISIRRVKSYVYRLNNPEHILEIMKRKGDNLHFIGVVAKDVRIILKGLKRVIKKENPKTISWFKPSMSDLKIIRGEI